MTPTFKFHFTDAVRGKGIVCMTGPVVLTKATERGRYLALLACPAAVTVARQLNLAVNLRGSTEAIVLAIARTPETLIKILSAYSPLLSIPARLSQQC